MSDRRVRVGVWAAWEEPVNWIVEGVLRVLAFLVEGAAICGSVTFCIVVSPANHAAALKMLRGLAAREGSEWILICNGPIPTELRLESAREPCAVPSDDHPGTTVTEDVRRLRFSPGQMRWLLLSLMAGLIPVQFIRALVRPLWRLLWLSGLSAMPSLINMARLAWRDPVAASAAIASTLERKSWPAVRAVGQELHHWHIAQRTARRNTSIAPSTLPETEGWLLLMPDFIEGLCLPGRKVALFPDAIPCEFPFVWEPAEWEPGGRWHIWKRRVSETLAGVEAVITFSRHVAERHVVGYFGVPPEIVRPVSLAPTDLRPLLPAKPPSRTPTAESRQAAAELLRRHASERSWPYLQNFPFEDVPYVVVSTQDRPTKNLPLIVEAVRRLLRRDYVNVKLFMTARLDPGQRLTRLVHDTGMRLEALSLPNLPPDVHAALYHCADVTVHPSFFEGVIGVLPFAESVSLGTPCLMARGPHTLEFLEHEPACEPFLFDPYDVDGLVTLVRYSIENRSQILDVQVDMLQRLLRRSWGDVTAEYAAIISGK